MKYLLLLLCFGFISLTGGHGQTALSALKSKKPQASASAAKPSHTNVKKGLGNHQRPDVVENPKVSQAFSTLGSGNEKAAIALFDDYSNEDTDAAFGLGLAYYENDQIEEAIDALSQAIELDEENTDAYYILGVIYAEQGDFTKSADALLELLGIDEEDADAWFLLGFLYYHTEDQESASICLSIARDIDSEYAGVDYE